MQYTDCVIIGGGAAGLMCAATAGQRGRSVTVLDHANKVGKKILMSGGGRCNFTNYNVEPQHYLSNNPHFCISALRRYSQYDFLDLVHRHNLEYHEKTLGQLFCDHKAKDILKLLLKECDIAGVTIKTSCVIKHISSIDTDPTGGDQMRFHIQTSCGEFACHSLVVATGGLSIPTMGATGLGYDIAKQFGLSIKPRYASLVGMTLKHDLLDIAQTLAGVSMPVTVSCQQQAFSEALLFTHKGLSGPAILQISNYWCYGDALTVDFLPTESLGELLQQWRQDGKKASLKNLLAQYLPKRFVLVWLNYHNDIQHLEEKPIVHYSQADIEKIVRCFHKWQCIPTGTEGYKTAEVTKGGVDTDDISSKTFAAKKTAGLYFIGEVLDVTGWLGGYNFQWAWSSGYCAGQYV